MEIKGKKRTVQHRNDDNGVALFQFVLPSNKKFDAIFTAQQQHDYGIDGELQITINETLTGEFYKVQIKSSDAVYVQKDGATISFSIDIESLYYLVETVKVPTALIISDVTNKKVYWHPIQLDQKTRDILNESMGLSNRKTKDVTIYIDTANQLTKNTFKQLYEYFRKASIKLAQRQMLKTRSSQTLSESIGFVEEIESGIFSLHGYDWRYRNSKDPVPQGVMFSIGIGKNRTVDYYPNADFQQEKAPQIKLKAKFNTKSPIDVERSRQFDNAIKNGGSITLSEDNIDSLQVITGSEQIDNTSAREKYSLTISPYINRQSHTVTMNNGYRDRDILVDVWVEKGQLQFKSPDDQALQIQTNFGQSGSKTTEFSIHVDTKFLNSYSQELDLLSFLNELETIEISMIDLDGRKKLLMAGNFQGKKLLSPDRLKFIKAIREIELATSVILDYPAPDKITKAEISEVFWTHKFVTTRQIKQSIQVKVGFNSKPDREQFKVGNAIAVSAKQASMTIFGKEYLIPNTVQEVRGVITELKEIGNLSYNVKVQDAEIFLSEDQK